VASCESRGRLCEADDEESIRPADVDVRSKGTAQPSPTRRPHRAQIRASDSSAHAPRSSTAHAPSKRPVIATTSEHQIAILFGPADDRSKLGLPAPTMSLPVDPSLIRSKAHITENHHERTKRFERDTPEPSLHQPVGVVVQVPGIGSFEIRTGPGDTEREPHERIAGSRAVAGVSLVWRFQGIDESSIVLWRHRTIRSLLSLHRTISSARQCVQGTRYHHAVNLVAAAGGHAGTARFAVQLSRTVSTFRISVPASIDHCAPALKPYTGSPTETRNGTLTVVASMRLPGSCGSAC
jgi:hypothetical protein